MLKKQEMMNEIINNYGNIGLAIIGIIGILAIKYFFKKNNKTNRIINKPLTERKKLIERLTDYELKRMPNQSRKEAKKLAMERWEEDSR